MLVAVERGGQARTAKVSSDSVADLKPKISKFVDPRSHLMSNQHSTYQSVGKGYHDHQWVHHGEKEFARGDVRNNTAESFNALLERAKQGVFHYLSKEHLQRYLHEFEFRWNHRKPKMKRTRKGNFKLVMV